jgi:hypothetical protein
MKYTISNKRLFKVVDRLINNYFSSPLVLVPGSFLGDYLSFVPEPKLDDVLKRQNETSDKMIFGMGPEIVPFERNAGGRLFINNGKLYNMLSGFLGLDNEELNRLILEYMKDKYNTFFDQVTLDFI